MIPNKVHAVLDMLRKVGYEAYVAGGAARDLHYGRVPKDWDIVLIGPSADIDLVDLLVAKAFGSVPNERHTNDDYMGESMDGRLEFVLQYAEAGLAIDILQYSDEPKTIEDQLRMFDCNLSYFWVDTTGEVRYLPDAHTISAHVKGEVVVFDIGTVRAKERRDHLASKFPGFTFPDDDLLYKQVKGLV